MSSSGAFPPTVQSTGRPADGFRWGRASANDTGVIWAYDGPMSEPMASPAPALSERDAAILDFEKHWWSLPGSKETEIRERFDISAPRYYQILNGLIDSEAALAYDPLLVKRLRRLRAARQKERSARRLGVTLRV